MSKNHEPRVIIAEADPMMAEVYQYILSDAVGEVQSVVVNDLNSFTRELRAQPPASLVLGELHFYDTSQAFLRMTRASAAFDQLTAEGVELPPAFFFTMYPPNQAETDLLTQRHPNIRSILPRTMEHVLRQEPFMVQIIPKK